MRLPLPQLLLAAAACVLGEQGGREGGRVPTRTPSSQCLPSCGAYRGTCACSRAWLPSSGLPKFKGSGVCAAAT